MGGGFWSQKILQVFLLTVEGIVFVFFPGCTLCGSSLSGFISELSGKPLVKVQVHCQAKCLSEESEHLTDVFFFPLFSHTHCTLSIRPLWFLSAIKHFNLVSSIWRISVKSLPIPALNVAFPMVPTQKTVSIREANPLELIFQSDFTFFVISSSKMRFNGLWGVGRSRHLKQGLCLAFEHQIPLLDLTLKPWPKVMKWNKRINSLPWNTTEFVLQLYSWEWEPYWIFKLSSYVSFV